ncbi:hypothetical protein BDP27DRAFT_1411230 [Rhodocollybia butyracea]|uniref:Uncharacterized protein n=1 Tax=Rhodocollybia butyracea TaxID=206335 RepID=A0A9P5TVN3_9AGAR|nr:hypothetical protein BDP27DRAFT_1411230 [Rhodocollybia butyracea]
MTRKQSLPPSSVSEDRMERPIPSVTAQSRCNASLGYNFGERGVRDGWNDVGEVGGTNTRNIREWGNNSSKLEQGVNRTKLLLSLSAALRRFKMMKYITVTQNSVELDILTGALAERLIDTRVAFFLRPDIPIDK